MNQLGVVHWTTHETKQVEGAIQINNSISTLE